MCPTCSCSIKASEGGGGKGIRKAETAADVPNLFLQVQAEVPGSPIFVMAFAPNARHLEVQLLADNCGQAISLFGRDCSIQRRHQKIIEEAPITVAPPELLADMERAAVRLAGLVGYVSTGTVEYLYNPETNSYCFLELNPRLQVEHPCTEMVTNVNLPACQLQIGMGLPLHRIKEIRVLYRQDPLGSSEIDFDSPDTQPEPSGHVIAARITSENPDEGFKPSTGAVQDLIFRGSKNVWGYFSVVSTGGLHEFADSQFGHCFSFGDHREAARENLIIALKELSIRSDFRTTVEYLIRLLEDESFAENRINTGWLDRLIAERVRTEKPNAFLAVISASLHLAYQELRTVLHQVVSELDRGQSCNMGHLKNSVTLELVHQNVKYRLEVVQSGESSYFLLLNGSCLEAEAHRLGDGGLLLSLNGSSYSTYSCIEATGYRVIIDNQTCTLEKEHDPTVLMSPSPGKLLRFTVPDGGHVTQDSVYAEIEVMKMVMELRASESGCVRHQKRPGAQVAAGEQLASLELDDPSRVRQAELYTGGFPASLAGTQPHTGLRLNQIVERIVQQLKSALQGYVIPEPNFSEWMVQQVETLLVSLKDPALPLVELKEMMSQVSGRIPTLLEQRIREQMAKYASNITSVLSRFPAAEIEHIIDAFGGCMPGDKQAFYLNIQPISGLLKRYRRGSRGNLASTLMELLDAYYEIERHFQSGHIDKCIAELLEQFKKSRATVANYVFSHSRVAFKNRLIVCLLEKFVQSDKTLLDDLREALIRLTTLRRADNASVVLKARQLLIYSQTPAYELRHNQVESFFLSYISSGNSSYLEQLIQAETSIFDLIPDFFFHHDPLVRIAACEVYIRRAYIAYDLTCVQHSVLRSCNKFVLDFRFLLPSSHPNRHKTPTKRFSIASIEQPVNDSYESLTDSQEVPNGAESAFVQAGTAVATGHKRSPSTGSRHQADGGHMKRIGSATSLQAYSTTSSYGENLALLDVCLFPPPCQRMGAMTAFASLQEFESSFDEVLDRFKISPPQSPYPGAQESAPIAFQGPPYETDNPLEEPIHIINMAIRLSQLDFEGMSGHSLDNHLSAKLKRAIASRSDLMKERGIRRVTFICVLHRDYPKYFTFRCRDGYAEDVVYRHLEPALAFQLEINRLRNFELETLDVPNHRMHLYLAKAQQVASAFPVTDYRFFARCIIRHADLVTKEASFDYLKHEAERVILEALDSIELAFGTNPDAQRTDCNHIFINFVPTLTLTDMKQLEDTVLRMVYRYGDRFWKLRILQAEIKLCVRESPTGRGSPIRIVLSNESGVSLAYHVYNEVTDSKTGQTIFSAHESASSPGPLQNMSLNTPYQTKDHMQVKRSLANNFGTTYVYDFPDLFMQALQTAWTSAALSPPQELLQCRELVLSTDGQLVEQNRPRGSNDIGMVAWEMRAKTPQYPDGRRFIVIANDITHLVGSFGVKEDQLYHRASERARRLRVPRIYLAANSGARIGLSEEVRRSFRVAWEDPADPHSGVKYLYLTPEDYKRLSPYVACQLVEEAGESRYRLSDIYGKETGLGVENLRGSGLIAGETSRAYNEVVTMSLVTCRSIGIGAYVVRLGQRVVQRENSHIILTGAQALNKLLGREVYTSSDQLGGPQIMGTNGVSHQVVSSDLDGVRTLLKWLSYIPATKDSPLPVYLASPPDPIERPVGFDPSPTPYDPRLMLRAFFDAGSFNEILEHWGATVVCGRARLGGIPCGAVAVETRTVEVQMPADPANPESDARTTSQAGQVWFPDSAFKTSAAIRDFGREGLPLMVFANWRGFSGGMKDMHDQILKFGAMIVDALCKYPSPVMVYIPPQAELRGGAWVVIDPSINPDMMEMYADADCRGGVLEPEGTIEIRYRERELVKTMQRLDDRCAALLKAVSTGGDAEAARSAERALLARQKELLPAYTQVALRFADLHDTPGRMLEKGCISAVIRWESARPFFYHRLRRRLAEERALRVIQVPTGQSRAACLSSLRRLFLDTQTGSAASAHYDSDNAAVADWLSEQLAEFESGQSSGSLAGHITQCRRDHALAQMQSLLSSNPSVAMDAVVHALGTMAPEERARVETYLGSLSGRVAAEPGQQTRVNFS
ncbi:hypothetical protein BOX15_Mlig015514g1 [Macrostomum lignano]|uniref:Uncharacterized protein n=1 Tax=Macrostomum lignano TaxID=282301 RepID=A0A267EW51_9PLAT|nr:hypothetical protein BOX15_Mlig015514g1 [Macrostomum lignano]